MKPKQKNNTITSYSSGASFFSGAVLKGAAAATMVVDHFAAVVIRGFAADRRAQLTEGELASIGTVYEWMRHIGRTAFPIFAFLLLEGFYHTRDRKKYAARLFLFAVLSEIPYDLAVSGRFCDWNAQNTLFTLFFGLLVIWLMDAAYLKSGRGGGRTGSGKMRKLSYVNLGILFQFMIAAAGCGLAYVCRLDYRWQGIALIAFFYLFRSYRAAVCLGGFCILAEGIPWSAPAFWMIFLYNGRRGEKKQKWLYFFYPLHLLLLYAVLRIILLL